jgi:hypothetical protein
MADRILTWYFGDTAQPSYYMEKDYVPVNVRLHAVTAPAVDELEVDITDDGVSIFANQSRTVTSTSIVYSEIQYSSQSGAFTAGGTVTGGTSGATGIIVSDTRGELKLQNENAISFTAGETITSGAITATVDGYKRGGRPQKQITAAPKTVAILSRGENLNEIAENFPDNHDCIKQGSMVTCKIIKTNGAGEITVQLELETLSEGNDDAD